MKTDPTIYKNYFSSLNISASALKTQRKRLDVIAMNLANMNTVRTEEGGPFKRKIFIQKSHNEEIFDKLLSQKSLKLDSNNELHLSLDQYDYEPFESDLRGVDGEIKDDPSEAIKIFDPNHPDADSDGYILKPNINVTTEMVDMISAQKEYEANISAIVAYKEFAKSAMNI